MSAKQRFQATPHAKEFTELMDSARMQYACDMAMIQFQSSFQMPSDMATAAANEFRRQGAREFLTVLQNLAINPQPQKQATMPALNPTA